MDRYTSESGQAPVRAVALLSLGVLTVLCIGAAVFYQERMTFVDAPFILFKILQEDKLAIMVGRFGSAVTQVVPWFCGRMSADLSATMLAYSLSFNLFYLLAGYLLFRMRQYPLVILLACYHTLFVTDVYFWTNNEVHQGITWMCLAWGCWFAAGGATGTRRIMWYAVSALLMFTAIFCHPLLIPACLFLLGFYLIAGNMSWRSTSSWFAAIFLLAVAGLKYWSSTRNWYDSAKIAVLQEASATGWQEAFGAPVMRAFWEELLHYHWGALIIMLASLWLLVLRRWLVCAWIWGFGIAYLALVAIVFPEFIRFYIESQWMPLALFWAAPVVYLVLPAWNRRRALILFSAVFLAWGVQMWRPVQLFRQRLQWHDSVLDRMEEKGLTKLVLLEPDSAALDLIIMPWGLPVESLLRSVQRGRPRAMTFFAGQPERASQDRAVFVSCFDSLRIGEMNHRYFNLDTTNVYQVIPYGTFRVGEESPAGE